MDYAYSILMLCFAGALLLYGLLIRLVGMDLVPRHWVVKPKDMKAYGRRVGKIVCMMAIAPTLSALVGLTGDIDEVIGWAILTLIAAFIILLYLATRMIKDVM